MHFPVQIGINEYTVDAHLIFETLGFLAGFRYYLYLRNKSTDRISESNRIWIIIGATFGAFFFSRLVGSLEQPDHFFHTAHPLLYFYANKSIVGGLLGGLLMVELTKIWLKEKNSSGDLFTYPIILAMIIGRIGCFCNGVYEETYGIPTKMVTGINLGDGLSRHPVTLYEIVFLLILWLVLWITEMKFAWRSGYRFQFFMIGYLFFRLLLDFIKPGVRFFDILGTIQICCILGLIYYRRTIMQLIFKPSELLGHAA